MAWNNTGSVVVTAGAVVGTGTLFLSSFVGDAFVNVANGLQYEIATITDNTHMTLAYAGLSVTLTNGSWSVEPVSPLRQTTATLNNLLGTIIGQYGNVLSVAGADKTVTLNKTALANNAGIIVLDAGVAVARLGVFGDDNLHLEASPDGSAWNVALNINKTSALATVFGDPTSGLGIATKQYVDGKSVFFSVRLNATTNVTTTNPGTAIFDSVTAANGDIVLLTGQTTQSQNGPWIFNGSAVAMTRPGYFATGYVTAGDTFSIQEGTASGGRTYRLTTPNPITVGTTNLTFSAPNPSLVLTSAHILVGNGSNVAADVAVSGDLTLANTGAYTVAKIQGVTVSGVTGTGNVVFSIAPALGDITVTSITTGGGSIARGTWLENIIVAGSTLSGTGSTTGGVNTVTGLTSQFLNELRSGETITISGETQTILAITSATALTTVGNWTGTFSGQPMTSNAVGNRFQATRNGNLSAVGTFTLNPSFLDGTTSVVCIASQPTIISTSSSKAGQNIALNLTMNIGATNTSNWTNTQGGVIGFKSAAKITSGATGTVTQMVCGYFNAQNNSSTAICTNILGVIIDQPAVGGGATNVVGLHIGIQAGGTNNAYLLINTVNTYPTGSWGIYDGMNTNWFMNGRMTVKTLLATPLTFATLPASPTDGERSYITDCLVTLTAGIGTAVTVGGGSNHVPLIYDGGASTWRIGG